MVSAPIRSRYPDDPGPKEEDRADRAEAHRLQPYALPAPNMCPESIFSGKKA